MLPPRSFFSALALTALSFSSFSQNTSPETSLRFSGFGRVNFLVDNKNLGRDDLFKPSSIVVGADAAPNFFISARQTRLSLDFKQDMGNQTVKMKLEVDFHDASTDVTPLVRMRLAFIEYRFMLLGQYWSNFFEPESNPSIVDFEGPNSSTLSRTPQFRLQTTLNNDQQLALSFENPTEQLRTDSNIVAANERFPDVIGSYRLNRNFGLIKLAALVRELRYQSDKARSLVGWGFLAAGKINVAKKDKLRFEAVAGNGIAKYVEGLSGLNYDAVYNGTEELESLLVYGGYIAYEHHWNEKLNSSLVAGSIIAENNPNLLPTDFNSGFYGGVNLFCQPVKNLVFGFESLFGQRTNFNEDNGTAFRLQANCTYNFSLPIK
jgi:hypothetical protein